MTEQGRYFYVDSINGDDSCSGFTPEEAWKSLEKVNEMIFQPGGPHPFPQRRRMARHASLSGKRKRLVAHCSGSLWGRRDAPKYMVTDVMRQFCWKASAIGG